MTVWLYPQPLAFLPYVFFSFAISSAQRGSIRAILLVVILFSVGVGFWFFWDASIRPSTLNVVPLEIVVAESLVAGATWLSVRRIKQATHAYNTDQ
jgi:hypothetical protein